MPRLAFDAEIKSPSVAAETITVCVISSLPAGFAVYFFLPESLSPRRTPASAHLDCPATQVCHAEIRALQPEPETDHHLLSVDRSGFADCLHHLCRRVRNGSTQGCGKQAHGPRKHAWRQQCREPAAQ